MILQDSAKTIFPDTYVSIVVITYNHENYLRQCLDSILMQEVDYSIEIIIGDDCSTDKTPEIIKEYSNKYPNLIKSYLRSANLGATKNLYDCFTKSSGKYIAILDGDDFWTDKSKLTTQINFLEKNNNYIACTQRYKVVDENNTVLQEIFNGEGSPSSGDYTLDDFKNYIYYGHQGTILFKNIFIQPKYDYSIMYKADRWICDITLCLILTAQGKIFVSDDNMTSYRRIQKIGGTNYCSSIIGQNRVLERLSYLDKLENYCRDEMSIVLKHKDRIAFHVWWSILYVLRYPSYDNFKILKQIFKMSTSKISVYLYILIRLPSLPFLAIKHFGKKFKLIFR